ncbi:diguanylate cyclase domain-containing protein [Arcobacter sp.]|uniref:diguanylate cyclase domain-containing protein n=1 Tax=Arcobacter sp. TaxID=1872629 RepID=UPI003D0F97C7
MSFFINWILKQSILKKFIYSNIFSIIIALVPIIFVMVIYEYYSLRNTTLEKVWVQAEILGESSSAALAFQDNTAAKETLLTLSGARDLTEAHLLLPNGDIFESFYGKNKLKHSKSIIDFDLISEENITLTHIIIKKPIYLRSQFVGFLVLSSSLDQFYKRLGWYILIILATSSFGFLLAWLMATRISKMVTSPLSSLTTATQRIIQDKDYTIEIPEHTNNPDEVSTLSNAFGEMISQIRERDLSLQQLAYYDRVTGIPNRHYFEERINQAVTNARKYGTFCYLLMIDLDDFKIVNDTLGHNVGDELLRYVSNKLKNTMRKNDSIFRIGGDEFAVIIESNSKEEPVNLIAEKIIQSVSTPTILEGNEVKVGASIGISCFPIFSSDVFTLMSTADVAMYAAKKENKNTYKVYDEIFK